MIRVRFPVTTLLRHDLPRKYEKLNESQSVISIVKMQGTKRSLEEEHQGIKFAKSTQTEEEEYEDLLGYCRTWNVKTVDQFWRKWIGHPKARSRLDIFGEVASYQSREASYLEAQVRWVLTMWWHTKKAEEALGKNFENLCEAVRYLEKEKIIERQDNI